MHVWCRLLWELGNRCLNKNLAVPTFVRTPVLGCKYKVRNTCNYFDVYIYRPPMYDGRLCFHFVHHPGGGHLNPIIPPLIPCSFWEVPPSPSNNTSTGPMSFLGVPQWPAPGPFQGGTPLPGEGYPWWGTHQPGSGWGTSPVQVRMG